MRWWVHTRFRSGLRTGKDESTWELSGMYCKCGVCGTSQGRLVTGGEFPAVRKSLQKKSGKSSGRGGVESIVKRGSEHPEDYAYCLSRKRDDRVS